MLLLYSSVTIILLSAGIAVNTVLLSAVILSSIPSELFLAIKDINGAKSCGAKYGSNKCSLSILIFGTIKEYCPSFFCWNVK